MIYSSDDPYNDPYNIISRKMLIDPKGAENRVQLRGCGNPDCRLCNFDIAERRREQGLTGTPVSIGGGGYAPPRDNEPISSRDTVKEYIIPVPEQAFDDIVGQDAALSSLRDAIEAPARYADLYAAYGMKMPKGALLSGPPGCGKTMFARAAASEMKRLYGMSEFISISGGELQTMFVGQTEAKIKAIFTYAREYKHRRGHPLLIFIDEAEVLFPDRTGRVRRIAPWEESQVATFLAELDGMQEVGAFVLLSSNRPEVMDQALLRDGRCDFKVMIRRPTQEAVETIVRRTFASALCADDPLALTFAAVESFYDPHKVILDIPQLMRSMNDWFESRGYKLDENSKKHYEVLSSRNFSFEHIVSGAMAASVASRATRHAFARDKLDGVARGITQSDVVAAVNDLFEENKKLEHQFAMREFLEELHEELEKMK